MANHAAWGREFRRFEGNPQEKRAFLKASRSRQERRTAKQVLRAGQEPNPLRPSDSYQVS